MPLRLLVVYLLAAGAAVLAARRWVVRIGWRPSFFLFLAPLLVTGKAVLTGGVFAPVDISYQTDPLASEKKAAGIGEPKNASLGDVVYQEIPWRAAVREAIREGRAPLWNRFLLCGEPLLAMMLPAVLHPFTWIGMLLPLPQAWTVEMTLGVFLALISAFLFLRDFELGELASAFGAAAWAFCDYLRFYAGWPLSPAAAAFPLLLLGLSRIARDRDVRSFGITSTALFLILNAGHPESALHAVAGGGVWFLFCLGRQSWRRRLRAVWISALAGIVVLGVSAVVLLPHVEALRQTFEFWFRSEWWAHQKKSVPWGQSFTTFQQTLMPYAFGLPGGTSRMTAGAQIPQAYLGALLLPFAVLGAASRRRERWALLFLALLGFGAWSHAPIITDAISALPLLDLAVNERLVFVGSFALAALGAFGLEEVSNGRFGRFLAAIVVVACAVVTGFLLVRPRLIALEMSAARADAQLALQVIPLVAAALVIALVLRNSQAFRLAGPALLVLLLAERAAETEYLYPVTPARGFYPPLRLVDPIPRNSPYRMASLGMGFLPNVATLYGVEDVRGYEAMTFKPLFETFHLWSIHQPVWFNRIDDPTRPFLSFLNLRWVVAPPGMPAPAGWTTLASAQGGSLWENPHVLPRAFIPKELWLEPDVEARVGVLGTISDFRLRGVVGAGAGVPERRWIGNGDADVKVSGYRAERIELDVDAREPALVATSITNWKGWRVRSEGNPLEIVEYNRAFVSFRVPAGRHRVEMLYRPRSAVAGAAISASAAAAVVLYAVGRRVRTVMQRTRAI